MNISRNSGFTLIDLLIALSILAITFGFALPAFDDLLKRNLMTSKVLQLKGTLQLGRLYAVEEHKSVTICPTDSGKECSNNWSNGYMTFVDSNANRQLEDDEILLRYSAIDDDNISLKWRAFGVRSSLQWHQTGITNHQNGYFALCFKDKPKLARALIISKAGRIRHSEDSNGNDIQENANDEDLNCSST